MSIAKTMRPYGDALTIVFFNGFIDKNIAIECMKYMNINGFKTEHLTLENTDIQKIIDIINTNIHILLIDCHYLSYKQYNEYKKLITMPVLIDIVTPENINNLYRLLYFKTNNIIIDIDTFYTSEQVANYNNDDNMLDIANQLFSRNDIDEINQFIKDNNEYLDTLYISQKKIIHKMISIITNTVHGFNNNILKLEKPMRLGFSVPKIYYEILTSFMSSIVDFTPLPQYTIYQNIKYNNATPGSIFYATLDYLVIDRHNKIAAYHIKEFNNVLYKTIKLNYPYLMVSYENYPSLVNIDKLYKENTYDNRNLNKVNYQCEFKISFRSFWE